MSINDSILNSVGLTDKNIRFFISDNGDFNEWVTMCHNQHQALRYRATLMTVPDTVRNVVSYCQGIFIWLVPILHHTNYLQQTVFNKSYY